MIEIIYSAWIKEEEDPLMTVLTNRVQLVTGLKAAQPKEAEDYQVNSKRRQRSFNLKR